MSGELSERQQCVFHGVDACAVRLDGSGHHSAPCSPAKGIGHILVPVEVVPAQSNEQVPLQSRATVRGDAGEDEAAVLLR